MDLFDPQNNTKDIALTGVSHELIKCKQNMAVMGKIIDKQNRSIKRRNKRIKQLEKKLAKLEKTVIEKSTQMIDDLNNKIKRCKKN